MCCGLKSKKRRTPAASSTLQRSLLYMCVCVLSVLRVSPSFSSFSFRYSVHNRAAQLTLKTAALTGLHLLRLLFISPLLTSFFFDLLFFVSFRISFCAHSIDASTRKCVFYYFFLTLAFYEQHEQSLLEAYLIVRWWALHFYFFPLLSSSVEWCVTLIAESQLEATTTTRIMDNT